MLLIIFLTTVLPGSNYGFKMVFGDEVNADLCKLPDGVFPHPDNCTAFIRCQSGEPDVELCSDGLLFNSLKLTCDFSNTGNCSDSEDFDMTSAMVETNDISCSEDGPNIHPILSNCSKYYMCKNNTAFKVQCPTGLLMNADKLTCDYPKNVECDTISSAEDSTVGIKAIYESDGEEESEFKTEAHITFSSIDKDLLPSSGTFVPVNTATDSSSKEIGAANSLSSSDQKLEITVPTKRNVRENSSESLSTLPTSDQTVMEMFNKIPSNGKDVNDEFLLSSSYSDKERTNLNPTTEAIFTSEIKTSSDIVATDLTSHPFHDYVSRESLELGSGDEDATVIQTFDKDINETGSGSNLDNTDIFTIYSTEASEQLSPTNVSVDLSDHASTSDKERANLNPITEAIITNKIKTTSDIVATDHTLNSLHDYVSHESLELGSGDKDATVIQTFDRNENEIGSGSDSDTTDIFTIYSTEAPEQLSPINVSVDVSDHVLTSNTPFTTYFDENDSSVTITATLDENMTSEFSPATLENEFILVSAKDSDFLTNLTDISSEDVARVHTEVTNSEMLTSSSQKLISDKTNVDQNTSNIETTEPIVTDSSLNNTVASSISTSLNSIDGEGNERYFQVTTANTTVKETDSNITPGRTLSTPQSLMSSDPLTVNEIFKSTTDYSEATNVTQKYLTGQSTATSTAGYQSLDIEIAETNEQASLLSEQTKGYETSSSEHIYTNSIRVTAFDFPVVTSTSRNEYFPSSKSYPESATFEASAETSTIKDFPIMDETSDNETSLENEFSTSTSRLKSSSDSTSISNFTNELVNTETITFPEYTASENFIKSDVNTTVSNFISIASVIPTVNDILTKTDTNEETVSSMSHASTYFDEIPDSYVSNRATHSNLDESGTSMQSFSKGQSDISTSTSMYFSNEDYTASSIISVSSSSTSSQVSGNYDSTSENQIPTFTNSLLNLHTETNPTAADFIVPNHRPTEKNVDDVDVTSVAPSALSDLTKDSTTESLVTENFSAFTENSSHSVVLKMSSLKTQQPEEITEKIDLTSENNYEVIKTNETDNGHISSHTNSFVSTDTPLISITAYLGNLTGNSNTFSTSDSLKSTTDEDEVSSHETSLNIYTQSSNDTISDILIQNVTEIINTSINGHKLTVENEDSEDFSRNTHSIMEETRLPYEFQSSNLIETSTDLSGTNTVNSTPITSTSDFSRISVHDSEVTSKNPESINYINDITVSASDVNEPDYITKSSGIKSTPTKPSIEILNNTTTDLIHTVSNEITLKTVLPSNFSSTESKDYSLNIATLSNSDILETTTESIKPEIVTNPETALKLSEVTEDVKYIRTTDSEVLQTHSTESSIENIKMSEISEDANKPSESSVLGILTAHFSSSDVGTDSYTTTEDITKTDVYENKLGTNSKYSFQTAEFSRTNDISENNIPITTSTANTINNTESVTSESPARSSNLFNTEKEFKTTLENFQTSDSTRNITFTHITDISATSEANFSNMYEELPTSEATEYSENISIVTVSSVLQNSNKTLDPLQPKSENIDYNDTNTTVFDLTSVMTVPTVVSEENINNVKTEFIDETSYFGNSSSAISYSNDSFESTLNIPTISRENNKNSPSSLQIVTSDEWTSNFSNVSNSTLPTTYLNYSDSAKKSTIAQTTTKLQSESNEGINKPSTFSYTLTTDSYFTSENQMITEDNGDVTSAKENTPVSSTTELISTKSNSKEESAFETSNFTSRTFEESILNTRPSSEFAFTSTLDTEWPSKPNNTQNVPSSFTSPEESTTLFSSKFSTKSTVKTSNNVISTKTTLNDEMFESEAFSENKVFPSSDNLLISTDLLDESTSISSSKLISDTFETTNGITGTSQGTINSKPSTSMNFSIDSNEFNSSTMNTTEMFPTSTSESSHPVTNFKLETVNETIKTEADLSKTKSTDLINKIQSTSDFTSNTFTESSKKLTEHMPLTDFSDALVTGTEDDFQTVFITTDRTQTDDLIDNKREKTSMLTSTNSIVSITSKTLPENNREKSEYTFSTTDFSVAQNTVIKTNALSSKDISENDFQTIPTTETSILSISDTTAQSMNTDYSSVSITSRNLHERTEESTEHPSSTQFPAALRTRESHSTFVTESQHHSTSTTNGSIESTTTMNPICETSEGNFPHPDDCNKFYYCTKGIPVLSLCIGNEHFDPVKKICTNPCIAKCDPYADCETSESTTHVEELISQTTLTEELYPSASQSYTSETEETISYTTTPGYTTEHTILDKISKSTFEETSKITASLLSSTAMESTFGKDLTGSPTSHESSTTIANSNATKESTKIASKDYMSSTFTETVTTVLSNVTIHTDAPISTIMNTTVTYENTPETRTEIIDGTSTETSTEAEYEKSSAIPEFTEWISTTSFSSDDGDDASNTTSSFITSTVCENNDCLSSKLPTSASPVPFNLCHRNDFLSGSHCNEYLDCTSNVPIELECSMGLHFNPTTRVCDWPYNAECGTAAKPLYEPTNFKCPCKSCLIPSTTSCSQYYLCLGFTAYEMQCSNNLYFDRNWNTCNYAPLVDCNEPTISTTTVETKPTETSAKVFTTEASTSTMIPLSTIASFVCPSREGLYRYPGNCEMFYQCSNWYPYEMRCAATTHFSEITKRCEYPCDAKCDLTLNCGNPSTSSPSDPRCFCLNCKLPSPETCTKYIVCVNGRARIEYCPWGQTFDTKTSTCDWAHKVACHHSAMCPERNGIFSHKDDCHKFVHCGNGIPYVKNCPSVLEFDPVKKRCEWPTGRCSHSPIAKEMNYFKNEEQRKGWRCPKTFGYFSNDQHCNKFYHCSFRTPTLKECSSGLLYNPRYQTCDWKKHVRCNSNRQQKPRRCRVFDHHVICSEDRVPKPHTLCNMYYDCTAGRACAKQCPVGLYFNNMTGICDLPENVKCFNPGKEDYTLSELSLKCASGEIGRQVNPTNAACFYHCRQGKVVSGCCSKGHVYNVRKDKCERRSKSFKI